MYALQYTGENADEFRRYAMSSMTMGEYRAMLNTASSPDDFPPADTLIVDRCCTPKDDTPIHIDDGDWIVWTLPNENKDHLSRYWIHVPEAKFEKKYEILNDVRVPPVFSGSGVQGSVSAYPVDDLWVIQYDGNNAADVARFTGGYAYLADGSPDTLDWRPLMLRADPDSKAEKEIPLGDWVVAIPVREGGDRGTLFAVMRDRQFRENWRLDLEDDT